MVNSDQKVKKAEKLSAEKLSVKAIPHFNF